MSRPKQPKSPIPKRFGAGGAGAPVGSNPARFMRADDFVSSAQPQATRPGGQPQETPRVRVQINGPAGALAAVESDSLPRVAMNWSRVVRNRARWAGAKSSSEELNQESRRQLNDLGITDAQLNAIASAGILEVSIPYTQEEVGWEARIFPWEYVINAALKPMRDGPPLTVVRHLRREPGALGAPAVAAAPAPAAAALKILYVQAVPAVLSSWADRREQDRVISSLKSPEGGPAESRSLINPDLQTLTDTVRTYAPDVIHFTGFDTHQAAELLGRSEEQPLLDGVVLCSTTQQDPVDVYAEPLAKALNAAGSRPRLVGFNIYNSASRTAALAVAGGALAAVGFQDVIDAELAELFFSNFYLAWGLSGHDAVSAFLQAQASLTATGPSLTGSGIVLWRSESIVGPAAAPSVPPSARNRVNASAGVVFTGSGSGTSGPGGGKGAGGTGGTGVGGTGTATEGTGTGSGSGTDSGLWDAKWGKVFTRNTAQFPTARDIFLYDDIKPFKRLNYSLLQNNRGLFEKFVLKRAPGVNGRIPGLRLRVEIQAGGASPASYERTFDMIESVMPIEQISVPLVSDFLRSLRHTLKTNIYVSIKLDDDTVFDETYSVDLLAVDEWLDTESDRTLLPSFVLPGDPVVPRIVDAAQRYLVALRDDAGAGFDGYQALEEAPDDPDQVVDAQVRAIWTALGQDFPVKYINPPPTYTKDSQRLRAPSVVIDGRRGTCIDLALLMMACLEYIDIHPVIFLLHDHAFPGYWRSPSAQMEFVTKRADPAAPVALASGPAGTTAAPAAINATTAAGGTRSAAPSATEPWYFGKSSYDDIVGLIRAGVLVPLESVWLTRNKGFWQAIEQGNDNLHDRAQFESMMDLWLARDHGVTPLPILAEAR